MSVGRHAAFDSTLAEISRRAATFPTAPMRFDELWNRRDYDAAEKLARIQADTAHPRAALGAQNALVNVEVLHGQLRDAERRSTELNEARIRITGDTTNPHLDAYFHASQDGLRGDAPHGIATLDAALRAAPIAGIPVARDQSHWLALGYASLGAPAKAREVLQQLEARLDTAERRRRSVFIARVRGMIAMDEGKTDSAVSLIRAGEVEADGLPTNNCTVCTPLLLGLAFDRGKQPDSARAYLTQYVETAGASRAGIDSDFLAPALFRLGELYADAGDTQHATEYYGRFVDLWKHADPELQPRVADARARIARLNRSKQ